MTIGDLFGAKPADKPHQATQTPHQEPSKPDNPHQEPPKSGTPGQTPPHPLPPHPVPGNDCHPRDTCEELQAQQNCYLTESCKAKVNYLPRIPCDRKLECVESSGECHCDCTPLQWPEIKPCIAVKWGDCKCDAFETDDFEVLCITVCNCYCNVTFNNFSIARIAVTDMAGNPVATLPNGSPSVEVVPSGPICFGDIGPCAHDKPSCVSREFAINTCGAKDGKYRLSLSGVCFSVTHHVQTEQCFVINLCCD